MVGLEWVESLDELDELDAVRSCETGWAGCVEKFKILSCCGAVGAIFAGWLGSWFESCESKW